jgi:hypothetical protein
MVNIWARKIVKEFFHMARAAFMQFGMSSRHRPSVDVTSARRA